MPLQHVVKRGDSLWGLAGRHLGNYSRWPELVKHHNDEVRRSGGNRGRVFYIKDDNMIFVGQILFLPIRDKYLMRSAQATGPKAEAGAPLCRWTLVSNITLVKAENQLFTPSR
jgi:hypothetical protein